VLGGEANQIHLITEKGVESWPLQTKEAVAGALVKRIADALRRGANS
jgi:phosphopantothenoylcysteine decarboxylase/phosphopantothenate--cysteine ligase